MSTLTPIKAIRKKCVDCSGGILKEVKECPIEYCPLHPFRMGKRPKANNTPDNVECEEKTQLATYFLP